jgi:TolB protein
VNSPLPKEPGAVLIGVLLAALALAACAAAPDSGRSPSASVPEASPRSTTLGLFDGRIAFFGLADDGTTGIYVLDGRDGTVERVTGAGVFPEWSGLAWSPDGRSIAFSGDLCPPDPCVAGIAVLDLATRAVRNVMPNAPGVSDQDPSWSPDGLRLAFWSPRAAAGDPSRVDLFTVGTDGSALTRIPIEASHAARPAWSPDGQWIAFERSDGDQTDLAVVHPDGTAPRSVIATLQGVGRPSWAPDGRSLAYSTSGDAHEVSPGQFESLLEIRTVSLDGSGAHALFAYPTEGQNPDWSPDGMSMAFVGGPKGEPSQIWLIGVDGTDPRSLPVPGLYVQSTYLDWTATTGN